MNRLKRVWCWLAGHDWVQLLQDTERVAARAHLHTMAGTMGYCARCGFLWDDLPTLRVQRDADPNGTDPYRTPASLPDCKCSGGEIHPDCPRHFETQPRSSKPRPRRPAFRRIVIVTVNGRPVRLEGVAADQAEKILKEMTDQDGEWDAQGLSQTFSRAMTDVHQAMNDAFKAMDGLFPKNARVERVMRVRRTRVDDKDSN